MAPYNRGVLHQGRDDSSDDVYYHPALVFFGLLVLCGCIMAPMFWMLWLMRNDNRDDVMTEERLHRVRNWHRVKAAQRQQVAQQAMVQNDGGAVVVDNEQSRLSNVVPMVRKVVIATHQAVASQSRLVLNRIAQSFTIITRPIPRRRRHSHGRTGVSIDLPIMRQPAWQKLASGSVGATTSTTLGDFSKPTSAEVDLADRAGPSGQCQMMAHSSQVGQGLLGQHGVIDGTTSAEPQKPQVVTTVGLAIG